MKLTTDPRANVSIRLRGKTGDIETIQITAGFLVATGAARGIELLIPGGQRTAGGDGKLISVSHPTGGQGA